MRARFGVLLFALVGYTFANAQVPTPPPAPAFEVASVKQNISGSIGGSIQVPPAGTVRFTNMPLRFLIRQAYQLDPYTERYTLIAGKYVQLIGSVDGGRDQDVPRFDVQGKPPDDSQPRERFAMMRALLEERFKLRVHREIRQMPAYALTVARPGRLGPNLKPSTFDCGAYLAQRRIGGTAEEPVDARGRSWCLYPVDMSRPGVQIMRFAGPVQLLIQRVQPYVERPVIDATGLSGNVEWALTFGWGGNPPDDVPGILTALPDQLGLKLEPRQAPVEVLVVDSVEMPTPD